MSSLNTFENALKNTFNDEISITENGAVGFKTSGNKLLDINFSVSSLRNMAENEISKMFSAAYYENPLYALKWLFFLRDVRGNGMGERRSFRICFKWLANTKPDVAKKLIKLIPEFGRFDDLFILFGTSLETYVIELIDNQLYNDIADMNVGKPISLLAKWMPSINTSSSETVIKARKIIDYLRITEKQYRKSLSKLRAYLKVVEVKMSANNWHEIEYENVPSIANIKYKDAFLRHDLIRRTKYLDNLKNNKTRINSSVNFPCDIVHAYYNKHNLLDNKDETLEALWKALPDYTRGLNTSSTIVVADGSGSMTSYVNRMTSSMSALDVSQSLAIYFAEKLNGIFKNKYISFSHHPEYVDLSKATSLIEKLNICYDHDECENTNVEAVFDLLLESAKRYNLKQEEIPANILIISDMEFDEGTNFGKFCQYTSNYNATRKVIFENIKCKWSDVGYRLPRLIFWNVCSRTKTIPLQYNDLGVTLVSGFSPAIAQMIFSTKLDPYEVLIDSLNSPRYKIIENAVVDVIK